MNVLISLIESLIKEDKIIRKEIKVDGNRFHVHVQTKESIAIEFSFTKKFNNSLHDKMLDKILKLMEYDVEHNLPF